MSETRVNRRLITGLFFLFGEAAAGGSALLLGVHDARAQSVPRDAETQQPLGTQSGSNVGAIQALEIDVPESSSDLEERLIVRFSVGAEPVFGSLSGASNLYAQPVDPSELETNSTALLGSIAVGTSGLLWRRLNTYALATGMTDLAGTPALVLPREDLRAATPTVYPRVVGRFPNARAVMLQTAYGELDGLSDQGPLANLYLRAGRQSHFGPASITFDGATAGWIEDELRFLGRVGRQSAIFDRTQENVGLVAGGEAEKRWILGGRSEITVRGEYLHFSRALVLSPRDIRRTAAADLEELASGEGLSSDASATAHIGEFVVDARFTDVLLLSMNISFVNELRPSHIRVRGEWGLGDWLVEATIDQKIGRDLFYDLSAGTGLEFGDVNSTYEVFRINIPDAKPYTDLGFLVSWAPSRWFEAEIFPSARVVYGDSIERSPYDAPFAALGAGLHGHFPISERGGLEMDAVYEGSYFFRPEEASRIRFHGLGGETIAHDISLGLRYARAKRFIGGRALSNRDLTVGVQGWTRISAFDNTLVASSTNEALLGGRADVGFDVSRYAHLRVAYDVGLDSNLFLPHIGIVHRVSTHLEARY